MYKDKIYIFNVGHFPSKLHTEVELYKKHSSKPYNPTIANVPQNVTDNVTNVTDNVTNVSDNREEIDFDAHYEPQSWTLKKSLIFMLNIKIRSFFTIVKKNIKIKSFFTIVKKLDITGSNADLLSSELATLLTGRYVEIKMLPLSYKEFLDNKNDSVELFNEYINNGGLPYLLNLDTDEMKYVYIMGLYNTILNNDIVK